MKEMAYTKYGPPDVLELTEVEKPVPRDDEVLLKVHAASVNPAADWHLLTAFLEINDPISGSRDHLLRVPGTPEPRSCNARFVEGQPFREPL